MNKQNIATESIIIAEGKEILYAIGMSCTTPKIAAMLFITEATDSNHRSNIMGKL